MNTRQEVQCDKCAHLEVCAFKDDFIEVQKAVDNLEVDISTVNEGACHIAKISDISWINRIELECKYFSLPKLSRKTQCV